MAEESRDEASKEAASAVADAARARAELNGMRARSNALALAAIARDPAAAVGSPAGSSAVDLLVYMLVRVNERASELAAVADRSRIAGLTCESLYDGLGER